MVFLILCVISFQTFAKSSRYFANEVIQQILNESQSYNLDTKDYLKSELSVENFLDIVEDTHVNNLSKELLQQSFETISARLSIHLKSNSKEMQENMKTVLIKLAQIQDKL